jgi:hypothetical protein
MAIRFAKQAGNWSDPLTWDGGLTIPTTGDGVYLNNYNITIDQNITTGFISNSQTPIGVPLDPIPDMTSNTSPVGVGQAFATQNNITAWKVFRKGINTFSPSTDQWEGAVNGGQIGYQFNTPKSIQRYAWYQNSGTGSRPKDWTFQGSNDGVIWVTLHTVVAAASATTYNSPNISNLSSYTYYRINVTAVQTGGFTLWLNALNMTESTSLGNGYLSGGTATVNNNLTITSDFYTGPLAASLFTVPALTPNQVTFIGNAPGTLTGTGTLNPAVINATGTGTINYIGNLRATNRDAMGRGIQLASGTTLNFTGDILGSRNSSTWSMTNAVGIACGAGSTVNMVGSVISSETGLWNRGISTASNAIVNITGNIDGGVGTDSSRTCSGISLVGGIVTIVGNVYAGPNSIGVEGGGSNLTQVKITGNLYNWTDGSMAAFTRLLFLQSANMQWNFKKFDLTDNILYTPGVATGHPATNNVRTGIVYGPTNNLTGTCAVPPAAAVSVGVPVGNTVGTGYLNATDIWNVPLASITTPNSIGERLKDASTVQSTGAQLAAFLP